jgi:hypothetical protein
MSPNSFSDDFRNHRVAHKTAGIHLLAHSLAQWAVFADCLTQRFAG